MKVRYLFRGKQTDGDGWIIGYYYETQGYDCETLHLIHSIDGGQCEDYLIDPATLGQCTGLRDNNGTLIFEGDVIKVPREELGVVIWNETYDQRGHYQTCGFIVKFLDQRIWRGDLLFWVLDEDRDRKKCTGLGVEVVTNIHDNPELLERRQP